jgi:hypothetical protein
MDQQQMLSFTAAWTLFSLAAWGVLWLVCRNIHALQAQPSYAAYNLASTLPIVALSYYGVTGARDVAADELLSVQARMYVYDPTSEKTALLQIALQIYTTIADFAMKDAALLKPELLAHHLVTAVLMCVCLHPFGNSRMFMFFGLTELSSIPLNVVYLIRRFPALRSAYPTAELASKLCFSLSFLALRVVLSSKISWDLQRDLWSLYVSGTAHSMAVAAFVSISNAFVCTLQLYWATLIFQGLQKMLGGGRAKGSKGQ